MLSRAGREWKTSHSNFKCQWSVSRPVLESGIRELEFFANNELNQAVQRILLREDCLSSFTQAIKMVARIYWSEEDVLNRSIRLSQSGRRVDGMPREVTNDTTQLPHLKDLHELFMLLQDMSPQQWLVEGHQYKTYQTIYQWKVQITHKREASRLHDRENQKKRPRVSL